MKSLTSLIIILLATTALLAQGQSQKLCDNKGYSAIKYYKSEIIQVTCDTVYLINTTAYKLFDQVFRNHKASNSDMKRLVNLYDYSKTMYENRIEEQNKEYNALKISFDSLINNSQTLLTETSISLSGISKSLTRIDQSIQNATIGIEETKTLIRSEMKNSYKQKLKFGAGGFIIGIAATSLIFAIAD